MTVKQYNTKEYRTEKRLTAFVEPAIKTAVIKHAKDAKMSISAFIEKILKEWVSGR